MTSKKPLASLPSLQPEPVSHAPPRSFPCLPSINSEAENKDKNRYKTPIAFSFFFVFFFKKKRNTGTGRVSSLQANIQLPRIICRRPMVKSKRLNSSAPDRSYVHTTRNGSIQLDDLLSLEVVSGNICHPPTCNCSLLMCKTLCDFRDTVDLVNSPPLSQVKWKND